MRRSLLIGCGALLLSACVEMYDPVGLRVIEPNAVINGTPTGPGAFAAVGALLFDFNADGTIDGDDALCTGSLVASRVFLTAAHCLNFFPSGSQLYVSFDDDLYPTSGAIAATSFHFPTGAGSNFGNAPDIGVVLLPAGSTTGVTPYQLPPLNYLEGLAARGGLRDVLVSNVGYGVSAARTGQPSFGYDGKRNLSWSPFQALRGNILKLNMQSAATGEGGDCYGDSGGPKFLEFNMRTVVAVVSWGDSPCRASSMNYRTDTEDARAFLGQYVTLP